MAPATIIAIGASAGGVEALTTLVRELPRDLRAAILVVLHVPASGTSVLPQILDRAGPLPAVAAEDGMPVEAGRIHIAPPDRHMALEDGHLRLLVGPRENGHRPAIDPTFASVASFDGPSAGVILSGTRDDGTRGMIAIKTAGGRIFLQDPEEALFDGMIRSVLRYVPPDAVLPLSALATALTQFANAMSNDTDDDREPALETDDPSATRYTCPDCGGALWRYETGDVLSFRCSVGHAYSPESFDAEQGRDIESALWASARLLGDRRTLLEEMASRAEANGHDRSALAFREQAEEVTKAGETIRRLIEDGRLPLNAVSPAILDE